MYPALRIVALAMFMVGLSWPSRAMAAATAADTEFFEKKIRPVLVEHCYECHSAGSQKLKGGLHLDSRVGLLQGGDTGPALVPGNPEKSLLWTAMAHRDRELVMPPKKPKLSDAILSDVERWIRNSARWPEGESAQAQAAPVKPDAFRLTERKQRLAWVWEKPHRQEPPAVRDQSWPRGVVDRFVLQRLEKEGMQPAPDSEPEIWLRRVYFALIGLPPSPEEVLAFLRDSSWSAREQVVDRLLASAQFGERWARHWLDLVRYAESRGHESDYVIPNAYEYRDYVVRALNADVPYNAFVTEHIAGDVLRAPRRHPREGFNESILATGWAFLGEEIHAPVDTRQDENERIDNRIDVLTKTFLGLTVSCARCHDHKFDAISQRDYYALAGFFISTGQRLARFETMETEREVARQLERLDTEWNPRVGAGLVRAQKPVLAKLPDYLKAAVEASHTGTNLPKKTGPAAFSAERVAAVGRLASAHSLDSNILSQWTAAMLNAASDPADPLYPFTVERPTEVAREISCPAVPDSAEAGVPLPPGAQVRVNFGALTEREWYADGVVFGSRPVRPGELRIGAPATAGSGPALSMSKGPERIPTLRIATRAAAQTDTIWRNLDLSRGVEKEPTMFGSWKRDGMMIRSPKFELTNGKLHYLVRGGGRILASVDSQRLVTGPVHTVQVREWGYRDSWHWVSHDLSAYVGHRVAIEFSPGNEFETAIALIVESEAAPAAPPRLPPDLRLPAEANDSVELRNWLVQRPELFSGRDKEWPEPLSSLLRDYLHERDAVLTRVQWQSRTAPAMMEGNGVDEYLLVRGKHQTPKGTVPRRFLEAVSGSTPIAAGPGSGRWELAQTMTDPSNPLLARVFVNRIWHHLFGRGLVATVDNFGWLGERPSHPELLDDLAVSFIEDDGWSLKRLIRRLVLSRAYAMSSKPTDVLAEQRDPQNILLHRMNLKRLESEAIRDAMLAVSGRLDSRLFGVSVPLHPSQFVEARGLRAERGPLDGAGRRSLYVAARRNFLPMMMTAFDTPTPFTTVGRRNVSNVPGQMLFLMNDPFVHQQAEVWAKRVATERGSASDKERIDYLFLAAFGRTPTDSERARCLVGLQQVHENSDASPTHSDPWAELCHALLGVKEFIYVR